MSLKSASVNASFIGANNAFGNGKSSVVLPWIKTMSIVIAQTASHANTTHEL